MGRPSDQVGCPATAAAAGLKGVRGVTGVTGVTMGLVYSAAAAESPDDMLAQFCVALTALHLSVSLGGGLLLRGAWHGLYLWEHRLQQQRRDGVLHLLEG